MEPFNIQVNIEGNPETLRVVLDRLSNTYALYDKGTSIGLAWTEEENSVRKWCGEGMVALEHLDQIGEQIDASLNR